MFTAGHERLIILTYISSKNNNINFKSGPWYANAITYVTKPDAFWVIAGLEGTVDAGRATQAYKRGGKKDGIFRNCEIGSF